MAVLLLLVMGGVMVAVPSQTDLNQAEGGRECHFERFMQAAHDTLIQVHSGAGAPNEVSAIQILDVLLWMAFRKR